MGAAYPGTDRTIWTGFVLVLGIALLCTGISLGITMIMAAYDRVRGLAVLRLARTTQWHLLRLVGAVVSSVMAVALAARRSAMEQAVERALEWAVE
ncbi:hypothetical protein [Streptomyces sp. NPDC017991]|uniref:hypothetical protein n=1 Tax=Streptomyces sp. NPDC017991 TaxID=3365026 RepID=UPI00379FCD6A